MTAPAGRFPTSSDVARRLRRAAARGGGRMALRIVGRSGQGRPLLAATLTDPATPAADKQHVLVVAGQHGNEESGRLVALALVDWLLGRAGSALLRRQKIVVMPNVNPDGAEADLHETPGGIRPNLDHGPGGPRCPEARAVATMLERLAPEVFVDLHARGHAGCSHDMVLYPRTRTYTEDDNLFHRIAADMAQAGEAAGLPQVTHPLHWWDGPGEDTSSTALAYRKYKSIVMLTENSESNTHAYPPTLRARTGLAKVAALLAYGQRRDERLYYRGYPNGRVIGLSHLAVVAVGATAAQRRRSRVQAWAQAHAFARLAKRIPEAPDRKVVELEYAGDPLGPVGLLVQSAGQWRVGAVRFDGRALPPAETAGFYAWQDRCSTFVVAALRGLRPGRHELEVVLTQPHRLPRRPRRAQIQHG